MAGIDFDAVKAAITCEDFARAEGLRLKARRAVCPFHPGADGHNLAFKPSGCCYCYVCHKTADVIQLAAAVWGTNQLEAAMLLNERFKLGLNDGSMTAEDVARKRRERQRQREIQEQTRKAKAAEMGAAADDLREAEAAMLRFSPDDDGPAYRQALSRLGQAKDRWEMLQAIGR